MHTKAMGVAVVFVFASLAHGGPDTITYQGSLLNDLGGPVTDGTYRMQFKIFDAATAGTNRWQETDNVQVTRGLFATTLGDNMPLGGLFMTYPDLWLEVTADVDRSGTFEGDEVFSPRQNLTGVPWASPRLEPNDQSPNVIGGHFDNRVTSGAYGATISGGGWFTYGSNKVTDDYGSVGGGRSNMAGDDTGTEEDASYATVAGGYLNWAGKEASTVAGGSENFALGYVSTIAGGRDNETRMEYTTIGGGRQNKASGIYATVGGGYENTASGSYATVGGGASNASSGTLATVPGGSGNTAAGDFSFAAGLQAKARHDGSFVWADSTNAPFESLRDDQFRVRANGGILFHVNNNRWVQIYDDGMNLIDTIVGARLTLAGAWADLSDRNQKGNVVRADGREVLEKLADVPISTWNHKAEDSSIRHMGPMAQDLYAAFGLGDSDRSITTIDADGISMAAIQGLYQIVQETDAEVAALRVEKDAEIADLKAQLTTQQQQSTDVQARLAALEMLVERMAGQLAESGQ